MAKRPYRIVVDPPMTPEWASALVAQNARAIAAVLDAAEREKEAAHGRETTRTARLDALTKNTAG